ncbi:MAG: VOC family protein [Nitrosomonas sp.]|uniref:VOC family protein n=1 Tax=Nitrosomonas sp. TaxID=42353 RepID=UPI0025FCAE61|nr:VOC family protein [Nitrosomonas sp.]MBY0474952.1 VOC family protein [Nitrosomonas sp.]
MNNNPVGWFEIYVQDMDRAKRFYESVFQVQLERLNSPVEMEIELWSFPMKSDQFGASGALVKMEDGPGGGNGVLVYFTCADCAIEADRAATAGGHIVRERMPIGQYGFIALIQDTEGNMIGLHSMK